jgi:hypothetical protein
MRIKSGLAIPGQDEESAAPAAAAPLADEPEEVAEVAEVSADPMAEVPPELLAKPFKELTKEERIIVSRARSRAMRLKSGLAVPGQAEGTNGPVAAAAPEVVEEEPAAVAEAVAEGGADPMAEVPPELLEKPFKELTKEERVTVARARSRAMRAKAGLPVPGADA